MQVDLKGKILLFDFDGTLVETEYLAKEVVVEYFGERNLGFGSAFSELIVGRTWQSATENMIALASLHGVKLGPALALKEEFKKRYREKFSKGVRNIPGLTQQIERIRNEAKYLGIVTGSERDEVDTILKAQGLEKYFERIWAYGDYSFSKPDPSPYLTALRDLNENAQNVIVFEDSEAGMESAFRAGLPFVQIMHEAHAKKPDPRSLLSVQNFDELF